MNMTENLGVELLIPECYGVLCLVHKTQNKSDAIFVMSSHNILNPLKQKFGILFCSWLVKAYSMPVL